ncbi:MAG: UDP-N-acetylglucosamine 2-epimerase (non-hydrolyzing) [Gemmatimonadota bacterium]|nr:UDP-N-acetylglucosamine 2-epimerase (non-hydrolyzing) [Gemmatimonadota bacterium]
MTPSSRAKVLVVVGTRPEAIKMAPVVNALGNESDVDVRVALTGQHGDLVDQALRAFGTVPDYDLEIMKPDQSLYDVVHGVLDGLREVVRSYEPDLLLVQGDTATVFTASLVGFFEHVRVGHVEAGLRSGRDRTKPFPEEMFRRLTDVVADLYFAPTSRARDALLAEDVPAERVFVTGNTVVDALQAAAAQRRPVSDPDLKTVVDDPTAQLILLTVHRRESFGEPIRGVFQAVRALADLAANARIVYPVHPNPNVSAPARELLSGHPRIALTPPLDYFDLVAALQRADLVLTDSGGIQEEAPTFGAPVLVLRDRTERPEGVEAGAAEIVGTDRSLILSRSRSLLRGQREREGTGVRQPYGDGHAAARIADIVAAELTGRPRTTTDWTP